MDRTLVGRGGVEDRTLGDVVVLWLEHRTRN